MLFLLLSADDYLLPNALQHGAALFRALPQVGMVYGACLELSTGHERASFEQREGSSSTMSGLEFVRRSRGRNIVPTPTAMVRTTVQRLVGPYRPELPHSGDMELWLRCAARAPIAVTDRFLAVKRIHDANMTYIYASSWLNDCVHRHAAVESFAAGVVTWQGHRMARRLRRDLVREAVAMSRGYHLRGHPEESRSRGSPRASGRSRRVEDATVATAGCCDAWIRDCGAARNRCSKYCAGYELAAQSKCRTRWRNQSVTEP